MMSGTLFFNSITWAIRAQKLLEEQGFASTMRKVSNIGPGKGCGYGLDVQGDLSEALRLLDSHGIRIVDVAEYQAVPTQT